jgi:hypothetical protein
MAVMEAAPKKTGADTGNATGPANRATFQSTGQRAGILKLEDCASSLCHSIHYLNFVFCASTIPCKKGEEAMNASDNSRHAI